jgi:glycosyltransferase involved in cell wall biosynthesis
MKPIRVVYLDHTAKLSGGEIALARLLPALDRKIVSPLVVLAEDGPLSQKLRSLNVEVLILSLPEEVRSIRKDSLGVRGFSRVKPLLHILTYSLRVKRVLKDAHCDIVHTNSLKSAFYGLLAAKLARKKLIWHIRDTVDTSYLPRPAVAVVRFLARTMPNFVITNSVSTLTSLNLTGRSRSAALPSGIPLHSAVRDGLAESEFSSLRAGLRCSSGKTRVVLVGRISRWKGQHVLIEAARILKAKGYDLRYLIAGSPMFGEDEHFQELKQRVNELGLHDDVEFLGFVDSVADLLSTCQILVHTSITPEPFGQVIIEGMACGLPVIASREGGPREIITDGVNGILIEPGMPNQLADAIAKLVDDPRFADSLALNGLIHVQQNFTIDATARRVESIYQTVAGQGSKS